ncbi:type VI secretion system-associated protein TagF [Paracoccus fistulariae]|uniref:Type VI secretion system-associated protein TagF n=1 Tax=Paracoccus fistulariae TaxID=658446 RepID=A0ABY7SHD7_9RHOB|nr:type VI secretion system-associated protein TagF [Paracoccus fistulariae]MDB6180925.1 type VI secretion system-associated protein TagF [Paracoccus fistulariae]WCR06221.1 type VI secretion system-associated protein TagF [Paracoccus fistulariae]
MSQPGDQIKSGYFGKVPSQGDFVTRGLGHVLADRFDGWLRQCVRHSQSRMGRDWLQAFLVAPIWRFAIGPGLFGPDAIMGVMMPSVDRAGRYFPFVIVATLPQRRIGPAALSRLSPWYDAAEELALATLDPAFTLSQVDDQIAGLRLPGSMLPEGDDTTGTLWWTAQGNAPEVVLSHMPEPEDFDRLFLTEIQPVPDGTAPSLPARAPLRALIGSDIRNTTRRLLPADRVAVNGDGQAISLVNGLGEARGMSSALQLTVDCLCRIDDPMSMNDLVAGAKGHLGTANSLLMTRRAATGESYAISFATLLIQGHLFSVLWAGNTRGYLLRDGALSLLTRDHLDRRLTGILTRSLGIAKQMVPDIFAGEARPGDRFLLCSGSLAAVLSDQDIGTVLHQAASPEEAARALTQDAAIAGAQASLSAVAAFIT